MIPILILSMASFYVLIERYLYIRAATKGKKDLMSHIRKYLQAGDIKGAKMLADQDSSAVGKILLSGLDHVGKPIKEIEGAIENVGKLELYKMEKNLGILGSIAGIAPMFGFLGTIFGVIKIFYNISLADNISIGLIAGGLYEKMITSAAGLMIGIFTYIGYHYLIVMIDRVVNKMEISAVEFIDLLEEPVKA